MGNQLLTMIKMFVNSGTGWSAKGDSNEKKQTNIVATVFLIFIAIPLSLSFGFLSFYMAFILNGTGNEFHVLNLGMGIACLTMFFFGMLMIPSIFYFAGDIEHLLPLPIKPMNVINGKLFTTYMWENITSIAVFLPVMIGYSIGTHVEWYYWLYGLIVLSTISLIPMLYGTIINILLIRFTSFGKNKNTLSYVESIMSIVLSTLISVYLLNNLTSGSGDIFYTLAFSTDSFSMILTKFLPFMSYATSAMTTGNFIDLLIYLGFNLLVFGVYFIVAKLFYFDGVLRMSSGNKTGKAVRDDVVKKKSKKHFKLYALVKKEFINLFINPSYFSACIASNILLPLLFFLIPRTDMWRNIYSSVNYNLSILTYDRYMIILMIGLSLFSFGMNYIAATSISREGADYQAMKFLPVSYSLQILSKMIASFIISGISFGIVLGLLFFYIKISLRTKILGTILGLLVGIFVMELSIWLDLYNPTLNWDDEQKAVKQNFNGMIGLLLSLALVILLGFVILKINIALDVMVIILFVIFIALDILTGDYLLEFADIYFDKM